MDREELTAFADEHEAALLRYAYLLTGSPSEAEDLVQATFLRLLRPLGVISSPLAYARRMIYHQHCSVVRRGLPARAHTAATPVSAPSFEADVVRRSWMWGELRGLPNRQRAVLVLRYYEGLGDDEIAGVLGCRRGTVRSLASRAMQDLRSRLEPTASGESAAPGRRS